MPKEPYRHALSRLPLTRPTPEDMAALCPHLTLEEIRALLAEGFGEIVCPPLRVRGAFHVLKYEGRETSEEEKRVPIVDYLHAKRTRESYENGTGFGEEFRLYPHLHQALAFAEQHWSSDLMLDSWGQVLHFELRDPLEPQNVRFETGFKGWPRKKADLFTTLGREFDEELEGSGLEKELYERAITSMTLDPFIGNELVGGRAIKILRWCCSWCGGAFTITTMGVTRCQGCHRGFKDSSAHGTSVALPNRAREFLKENGIELEVPRRPFDPDALIGRGIF